MTGSGVMLDLAINIYIYIYMGIIIIHGISYQPVLEVLNTAYLNRETYDTV